MQCIFQNQIVTYIGEVAVHNMPGTPEAHLLYKTDKGYLTIGINDAQNLPIVDANYSLINNVNDIAIIEGIVRDVERYFGPRKRWLKTNRTREFIYPRHLLFWAVRIATSQTLTAISSTFEFNHATVIHAVKNIDKLIEVGQSDITKAALDITNEKVQKRIQEIQSKSIFINKQKVEL
jgi:Bacterial dnaA protein helix-turn-helix